MNLAQLILQSNLPVHELTDEQAKTLKAAFVQMYLDILAVCEKHHLTIMMGGGSCLGTIRHKGFIPWDDDIDLNMRRKDYVQLPALMQQEYGDKYRCVGANISENAEIPFMKIERTDTVFQTIYDMPDEVHGIGIDIFPIDNIPDSSLKRLWHGFWLNALQYIALCIGLYNGRKCYATQLLRSSKEGAKKINIRLSVGHVSGWFISCPKLYAICDRLAAKYASIDTKEVTIPTGRAHYFGEIQPQTTFFPVREAVFEGVKAYIPNDYDTYLRALYGDTYMQLPPMDKRERHFIVTLQIPN